MINLPPAKYIYKEAKTVKAPYFFKDVTLTPNGFKFEKSTEFKVESSIPQTTQKISSMPNNTYMNEYYIVVCGTEKRSSKIIYLKNLKFNKPGSNNYNEVEPENIDNYNKLENIKAVKLTFESRINKVIFNKKQIFFHLENSVHLYSPFTCRRMDIKAIDVAFNHYLYVLTSDKILVYNENLYKSIDIDTECDFIVPTTAHIFLIKNCFIYKITEYRAEIYFTAMQYVKDVVFDEKFMYISTNTSLIRLSLFDGSHISIEIKITNPKIKLMKYYILIYNSNNGVAFFNKNDLQNFGYSILNDNILGMDANGSKVVYFTGNEFLLYDYVMKNRTLTLKKKRKNKKCKFFYNRLEKRHEESVFESFFGFKCHKNGYNDVVVDDLFDVSTDSLTDNKSANVMDRDKVLDNKDHRSLTERHLGDKFNQIVNSEYSTGCDNTNMMIENDRLIDIDKSLIFPENKEIPAHLECIERLKSIDSLLSEIKHVNKYEDSETSESEQGLFFEEAQEAIEDEERRLIIDHLMNDSIKRTKKDVEYTHRPIITESLVDGSTNHIKNAKENSKTMVSTHKVGSSCIHPTNPITIDLEMLCNRMNNYRTIRFKRRSIKRFNSLFFNKNYLDFYKRRFIPRDQTERVFDYSIYDFVTKEYKRIFEDKIEKSIDNEKKINLLQKRKKSGF